MTIIPPIEDDLDLATEVLRIAEGSQRLPLDWTLRLAAKCLQQAERIRELEEQESCEDLYYRAASKLGW